MKSAIICDYNGYNGGCEVSNITSCREFVSIRHTAAAKA